MKSFVSFIALLIGFSHLALCQDTTFTQKDFDSAKVYYKTKEIPQFIKDKLTQLAGEKIRMVDAGRRFQATDNITTNLPTRRLICFIEMPGRYILFYEIGGRRGAPIGNYMIFKVNTSIVESCTGHSVRIHHSFDAFKTFLLSKNNTEYDLGEMEY